MSFVGVLKDNVLGERDRGDIITQHRKVETVSGKDLRLSIRQIKIILYQFIILSENALS